MPKPTSSGKFQINLSLDPNAYQLLRKHASTRKGFGQLVGELLRSHDQRQHQQDLTARIARLEKHFAVPGGE